MLPMTTITYTDNGLIIPETISDSELKQEIRAVFSQKESLPFVVGDLLVFLEKRSKTAKDAKSQRQPYNREHIGIYASLLNADKSNKSYLVNCKKVCSLFPVEKRNYPVPFYIYKEAVALAKETTAATELVKEAAGNQWSYRELRKTYRERQAVAGGFVNKEKPNAVAQIVKLAHDLTRKLSGDFTKDQREFILNELTPVFKWATEGSK